MTGLARTSLVLGVTGGIACGKSEVGRVLEKMGFDVRDADHVAHALMKKGTAVYQRVVDYFGERILSEDGEISRPTLGGIIFKNPADRKVLNRMVHPAVQADLEGWIGDTREQGKKAAVLIPLLFESGMESLGWDAILCVESSDALVLQRLEARGIEPGDAARRMASQMPLVEKKQRADYVVPNNGTVEDLEQSTRETVIRIMGER